MTTEERHGQAGDELLEPLVDSIWEESVALETILVVHGYSSLRHALSRTLQYHGYRTLEAASREQALRLIRAERPDVILLDRALEDGKGIALAAELAERSGLRDVPILALTSDTVAEETLREEGFRGALVMPVEQKHLLGAIDRVLETARRREAGGLRLAPSDEQCRLPLEDRLMAEHLTLFFHFPATTRIELRPGSEAEVRSVSMRLAALGIRPEIEMESGALLLHYEVSIAEALALCGEDAERKIAHWLCDAFPELASRPDALAQRLEELADEFRRLQKIAS
ncbi:MAG TPA: response regulator [Longimicrobiaceae bacterium]